MRCPGNLLCSSRIVGVAQNGVSETERGAPDGDPVSRMSFNAPTGVQAPAAGGKEGIFLMSTGPIVAGGGHFCIIPCIRERVEDVSCVHGCFNNTTRSRLFKRNQFRVRYIVDLNVVT
jgi:hypothetical protein